MRIGLATETAKWPAMWSGTVYYMTQAIERAGADLTAVLPVLPRQTRALKLAGRALSKVIGHDPHLNRTRSVAWIKAQVLRRALGRVQVDAVLAPVSAALIPYLKSDVPVIYVSDATVRTMIDYYPEFTALRTGTRKRAIALETLALARADLIFFPTWWAARSAIKDYGVDPDKIVVQAFGANISDAPGRTEALAPRRPGPLRLLFCGVEWQRKGGAQALATLAALLAQGIAAELVILGCVPPEPIELAALRNAVRNIPFLDKSDPVQRAEFRRLFLDADIFLLPTRAECYGVVYCEAAACGTPSVTTDTGGVPEVVRHGVTGLTLPLAAGGAEYAAAIRDLVQTPGRLEAMRRAARADFEERLNWDVWARAGMGRIAALCAPRTRTVGAPVAMPRLA